MSSVDFIGLLRLCAAVPAQYLLIFLLIYCYNIEKWEFQCTM